MTCSLRQRGRLADVHQEVVEVLEQGDLAVQLDVDLALERPLLHAGAPGAGGGDGLEQLVDAVRLGDVGVGADAEAVDAVLHVVEGGEHHDGVSIVARSRPQPAADVEAVDVGEHQVQEQRRRAGAPGPAAGRLAVLGDDRLEVAQPEDPGHQSRLVRMVFHDQSRCHRSIPRRASLRAPARVVPSRAGRASDAGRVARAAHDRCSSTTSASCSSWSRLTVWPSKTPVPQIRANFSDCSKSRGSPGPGPGPCCRSAP